MLVDNQTLVSVGAQLSKLNPTNKVPPSLAVDICDDMAQTVIPKASQEAIYIGGGLLLVGIL